MRRAQANREIYTQAKNLQGKIATDSTVYIHWKNNIPIVLPDKQPGFDLINTVKLESILRRQCWLAH